MPQEARGHTSWDRIRAAKVPPDQEAAIAAGARALRDALVLSELRKDRGVTQAELAGRLGKSQGNVSELERRDDVYLSSLKEYVEALGGELGLAAVFDGEVKWVAMGELTAPNLEVRDIGGQPVVVATPWPKAAGPGVALADSD